MFVGAHACDKCASICVCVRVRVCICVCVKTLACYKPKTIGKIALHTNTIPILTNLNWTLEINMVARCFLGQNLQWLESLAFLPGVLKCRTFFRRFNRLLTRVSQKFG